MTSFILGYDGLNFCQNLIDNLGLHGQDNGLGYTHDRLVFLRPFDLIQTFHFSQLRG